MLNEFVSPVVDDDATEVGWEELTLASTAHLLRTCLSRKEKGNPANSNQTAIDPIDNTEKLKRQIQACYERIRNGGKLAV